MWRRNSAGGAETGKFAAARPQRQENRNFRAAEPDLIRLNLIADIADYKRLAVPSAAFFTMKAIRDP